MARLPQPGSDKNVWGDVLNEFLAQSHNGDGTLKDGVVARNKLSADVTASLAKADTALQASDIAGKANTSSLATVATTGSYADLTGKPTIPAAYTDEQAQDAAAALLTSGTVSGISFVYDDANNRINTSVTPGAVADATTGSKGAVQLSGDLAGSAGSPVVAKVNGVTLPSSAPSVGQVLTATGTAATQWATPATAPVVSVAGRAGTVTLVEGDIANLTSDLAAKAADNAVVHLAGTETISGAKTFSGTVNVPTAAAGTNTTQAASTAFVTAAVANVSGGSGGTGSSYLTTTTQTSTAYSFALADVGTVVEGNSTSPQVFTVLPSSSVAWQVGSVIEIYQVGTGQISLAAGSGVTLQNPSSLNVRAQYGTASIRYRGSNLWAVSGDLA